MRDYNFTLKLRGLEQIDDDQLSMLLDATLGDASFAQAEHHWFAEFDRSAESLPEAIVSAQEQIESAVSQLRVVRVEVEGDDSFVTASDIAKRVGLSREAIRLLANGSRGERNFPDPVAALGGRQKIWRWLDVAAWFQQHRGIELRPDQSQRRFVDTLNMLFDLRERAQTVPELEQQLLANVGRRISDWATVGAARWTLSQTISYKVPEAAMPTSTNPSRRRREIRHEVEALAA